VAPTNRRDDHHTEASALLEAHADERLLTSFAVMRTLGINEALAFDGDFSVVGFNELRT
jgi:predicted nucleic acid-binding protein